MKTTMPIRECKDCYNYKHANRCMCSSYGEIDTVLRLVNIEDYDFDCFLSVEDKLLCDMLCDSD